MGQRDLITVVIPVYNVLNFLRKCLDSIVSQTYDNLQIILVDDGSTDGCSAICKEYASVDSRILLIHKENGGLSDARNVGISYAKGKFICFVDSDDVVAVDMIEYLYNLLIKFQADISVCQKINIDEYGNLVQDRKSTLKEDYLINGRVECIHDFLTTNNIGVMAWGKLYDINLFENVRYPINRLYEDVFTTHKLIGLCEKISVGCDSKYFYRQRNESIMRQAFSIKTFNDTIDAKIEKANYMKLYFPSEYRYACADIISSANICIYKMAKSDFFDKGCIDCLHELYRSYLVYFLFYSRSLLSSKIFSLIAYFDCLFLYRLLHFFIKR